MDLWQPLKKDILSHPSNILPSPLLYRFVVIIVFCVAWFTGCWGNQNVRDWEIDPNSCHSAEWPASRVQGSCPYSPVGASNHIWAISRTGTNYWYIIWGGGPRRGGFMGALLPIKSLTLKCSSRSSCDQYCSVESCFGFLDVHSIRGAMVSTLPFFPFPVSRFGSLYFTCKYIDMLRGLDRRLKQWVWLYYHNISQVGCHLPFCYGCGAWCYSVYKYASLSNTQVVGLECLGMLYTIGCQSWWWVTRYD